jgi:hypothetical protein
MSWPVNEGTVRVKLPLRLAAGADAEVKTGAESTWDGPARGVSGFDPPRLTGHPV